MPTAMAFATKRKLPVGRDEHATTTIAATDDDARAKDAEDYYDCDGNCLMDTDGDGVCDELEVLGCNSP